MRLAHDQIRIGTVLKELSSQGTINRAIFQWDSPPIPLQVRLLITVVCQVQANVSLGTTRQREQRFLVRHVAASDIEHCAAEISQFAVERLQNSPTQDENVESSRR